MGSGLQVDARDTYAEVGVIAEPNERTDILGPAGPEAGQPSVRRSDEKARRKDIP